MHDEIIPPTDKLAVDAASGITKHQKRHIVDLFGLADWAPVLVRHSTIPSTLRTRGALCSSYWNQH